ncbi:MAG: tryptophan 2,3-dioxygenase family protein [Planctomycetota bacterium]|jgi:tryptophan 2,3-dioxygenase|nr:tryptophan 2,3-dioxygenase family protein [Planctomycetota bacterium]
MSDRHHDYGNLQIEELNYNSYLKIPELTSLQELRSQPQHHDEMFFIVIHQSFELWFKEVLHELDLLAVHIDEGNVSHVLKVIKRINAIMTCLTQQIQLLGTLTPKEFFGFREALGTGSGFQSMQFREVEFALGQRDPWFFQFFESHPQELERLKARCKQPSIYDKLLRTLKLLGHEIPTEVLERDFEKPYELNEHVVEAIRQIYDKPQQNYHMVLLFEALIDLDTMWSNWRSAHILMVSRTIGAQKGTGGSSGAKFLESRLPLRFFPEIWEVRNSEWTK